MHCKLCVQAVRGLLGQLLKAAGKISEAKSTSLDQTWVVSGTSLASHSLGETNSVKKQTKYTGKKMKLDVHAKYLLSLAS